MNLSAAASSGLIGWFRVFFLPMSAKMGIFAADLWIFLADRKIGFAGDLKMFYYRDLRQ